MTAKSPGSVKYDGRRLVERLHRTEDASLSHARELDVQLRRMAEIQVQIDELSSQMATILEQTRELKLQMEALKQDARFRPRTAKATLKQRRSG